MTRKAIIIGAGIGALCTAIAFKLARERLREFLSALVKWLRSSSLCWQPAQPVVPGRTGKHKDEAI